VLSNAVSGTGWPKVARARVGMEEALRAAVPVPALFSLLAERADTPDAAANPRAHLEATLFVANPVYGTRSSTVVLLDARGELTFIERRFDPDGTLVGETAHAFTPSGSDTNATVR